MNRVAAIIMAGGRGVRMKASTSKMLLPILGRPLVYFPVALAHEAVDGPVVVVSGEFLDDMRAGLTDLVPAARTRFALQEEPLGTADAVRAGVRALTPADGCRTVLILNGDVPGTSRALLERLVRKHETTGADITVLGFKPADPTGYGRILHDDSGTILGIREEKELQEDERDITVVNAGIYLVGLDRLQAFLAQVKPSPNQREYLLTDVVEHIVAGGGKAEMVLARQAAEVAGVNNRVELAEATQRVRRLRNHALMLAGVGMPHPESVDVEFGVEVGPDTVLEANVILRGRTTIGSGCTIGCGSVVEDTTLADDVEVKPYCVLESSVVGAECVLGPFAHTRPGSVLHRKAKVGNFVETKKTVLGEGSKANHLTYLGDATIGKGVNVGAGTITCNYDGYRKYPTVIDDGAFIGSDTQFVAPVHVGERAVVAAGTTVTRDVPAGALAISRVDQATRSGYADEKRRRMAAKKDEQ